METGRVNHTKAFHTAIPLLPIVFSPSHRNWGKRRPPSS